MHAIKMLSEQHRDVRDLFDRIRAAAGVEERRLLCRDLAETLGIHMTIEEKIFYPATNMARSEDLVLEAVEEHRAAKRTLRDLVAASPADRTFPAKVKVLEEMVLHHIEEEEKHLFKDVKRMFAEEQLETIGRQMETMADELRRRPGGTIGSTFAA